MSLGGVFDIAGQGMSAQSIRLNTTASNLANAQAASSNTDEVYRARHPVFSTIHQNLMAGGTGFIQGDEQGTGLQVGDIVESDQPLQRRYEPNHPKADEDGYVFYPNVNVVEELVSMIGTQRAYEMNSKAISVGDQMLQYLNNNL